MNKLFYYINNSSEQNIIGVDNGVMQAEIIKSGFTHPERYDDLTKTLNTKYFWDNKDSIINMHFEIEYIKMLPKAKMTDFLHYGPYLRRCPFLISDKVSKIFSNFNIPNCQLHSSTVYDQNNNPSRYFLPYIEPLPEEILDLSKSFFYAGIGWTTRNLVQFRSEHDKEDFFEKNLQIVQIDTAHLGEKFDKTTDLFVLGSNVFISNSLKIALEGDNATSGVHICPAFGDVCFWPKIEVE